jgi:hypothetical protein
VVLRASIVKAERARAVDRDLEQAAGHDQVLDEVEGLVGVRKIQMEEDPGR